MEGPGSGQLKSIEWLSHGGKDIINNKAALYPNCYCKIYVLDLFDDRAILKRSLKLINKKGALIYEKTHSDLW